jgi:hypothetical protein
LPASFLWPHHPFLEKMPASFLKPHNPILEKIACLLLWPHHPFLGETIVLPFSSTTPNPNLEKILPPSGPHKKSYSLRAEV